MILISKMISAYNNFKDCSHTHRERERVCLCENSTLVLQDAATVEVMTGTCNKKYLRIFFRCTVLLYGSSKAHVGACLLISICGRAGKQSCSEKFTDTATNIYLYT